jgi:hypothetical protein
MKATGVLPLWLAQGRVAAEVRGGAQHCLLQSEGPQFKAVQVCPHQPDRRGCEQCAETSMC